MGNIRVIIVILVVLPGILCSACSVTRKIPDNQYLLQSVKIEDDKSIGRQERIKASELETYVRQTPNKRLLGSNFYAWLYQSADPAKQNWWNNWKRKFGEEPVLLDMGLTERSLQNLKIYMDTRGFFASAAEFEIDTLSRHKKAKVTFRVRQGEPYRIDTISYEFQDKFLEQIILPDTAKTLLRAGDIFDITRLDAERERITAFLQERGYFNFSVNNIQYIADTLSNDRRVGLQVVFKQYLAGYDARGQAIMDNNAIFRIKNINLFPNYDPTLARTDTTFYSRLDTTYYRGLNILHHGRLNIRPTILRQAVSIYPNYIFNTKRLNRTYSDLMSLGYFKSARITFTELPADEADTTAMVTFIGSTADTAALSSFTREGYLQCDIYGTPALRQSFRVDLIGSTTSSFYGLRTTIGYQNRNIFRGAESFDASFTAGYEFMKALSARKRKATEFGVTTGLTFPRFLVPWRTGRNESILQPKTKVELSVNFQDRPYYRRTLSSAGISYIWSNNRFSAFSLRPVNINVINVNNRDSVFFNNMTNKYLINSFKTQFVGGMSFGYIYNNQPRNIGGNATIIRFNLETAGNMIDAVERTFYSKPADGSARTIFGIEYSQYFRTDLSLSRKIMLGRVTALAGRLYSGVSMAYGNSSSVPFDRQFYSGGSNGMRGWAPRMLGQGSVSAPDDDFPMQTGDVKLEANLELRFPIWGFVQGATFFDLGNIWYIRKNPDEYSNDAVFLFNNFYKQLGFNTGLGIRIDIKFAVLRLDWGVQLHNPNRPAGDRWINNLRWKNTSLNFGVGYPF